MHLLDLSPEILEIVFRNYVDQTFVDRAWRFRLVCKTFEEYITKEIFGRRPIPEIAIRTRGKMLIKNGIIRFLQYRSIVKAHPREPLPSLIRGAVDVLVRHSTRVHTLTHMQMNIYKYDLSRMASVAIEAYYPSLFRATLKPTPRMITLASTENAGNMAMAIAIVSNDTDIIKRLVAGGVSLWEKTAIFGYPLVLAAKGGDTAYLRILLRCARENNTGITDRKKGQTIIDLIRNQDGVSDTLKGFIFERYLRYFGQPTPTSCRLLLSWAAITSQTRTLALLLNTAYMKTVKSQHQDLILPLLPTRPGENGKAHQDSIFEFLDRDILDINAVYAFNHQGKAGLLDLAVSLGNQAFVHKLMGMGADPNGVQQRLGFFSHPLIIAVAKDDAKMVEILLSYGADPEFGVYAKPGNNDAFEWYFVKVDEIIAEKSYAIQSLLFDARAETSTSA